MPAHDSHLPATRFRSGGSDHWMAHLATGTGATVEVSVDGAGSGPDATCLAHLNALLPTLDELVRRASSYLDAFVDRERLSHGAPWWLEGIRVAHDDVGKPQIELAFTLEGDPYGGWSVGFTGDAPTAFTRRQT